MSISRRNRRGMAWFLLIGLTIAVSPRLYAFLFADHELHVTFEELKNINEQLLLNDHKKPDVRIISKKRFSIPSRSFDPNKLDKDDWVKMGLSSKQADVVMRFTKHGIRSNDELKKIFVIPDELYLLIKDSTYYPPVANQESLLKEQSKFKEAIRVDLSICSQDDLLKVPGIGDYFGRKIIEYRERLGGYVETDQLMEVWKMDSTRLTEIRPYLFISGINIRKININKADIEQLKAHPYISYSVANSIVKLRNQNGAFSAVKEIRRSKLIDNDLYEKLEQYLTVEE